MRSDVSHHQQLANHYAQKWVISSIIVDKWERGFREELGTVVFVLCVGGRGWKSAARGGFRWLLLTTQCRCHTGRLEAGCAGLGRMRHQDSCVHVH